MRAWQCRSCGRKVVVSRRRCQFCGSEGREVIETDALATLVSWTVQHLGASSTFVVARLLDQLVPALLIDGHSQELRAGMALRVVEGQNGVLEAFPAGNGAPG